jgi:hypothetical protein
MREWYGQVRESNGPGLREMLSRAGMRVGKLAHFAFIPNGVGRKVVSVLRPLDEMFSRLPLVQDLAMRVGIVAY